jgi:hypothetical protein
MRIVAARRTSLWLELDCDNVTRVFELRVNKRPIVVGALLRADFRIDRVGIKPVHLQFERLGHYVLLTPAYGTEVQLNGELIREPRALEGDSLLEFSGVRMTARISERSPEVAPPPFRTPDPMITTFHPDDDDVEITEVIGPPANRGLEPPPLGSAPAPWSSATARALNPAAAAAPTHAGGGELRESAYKSNAEALDGPRRTGRKVRWAAIAGLVIFLLVLMAVLGLIRRCVAPVFGGLQHKAWFSSELDEAAALRCPAEQQR